MSNTDKDEKQHEGMHYVSGRKVVHNNIWYRSDQLTELAEQLWIRKETIKVEGNTCIITSQPLADNMVKQPEIGLEKKYRTRYPTLDRANLRCDLCELETEKADLIGLKHGFGTDEWWTGLNDPLDKLAEIVSNDYIGWCPSTKLCKTCWKTGIYLRSGIADDIRENAPDEYDKMCEEVIGRKLQLGGKWAEMIEQAYEEVNNQEVEIRPELKEYRQYRDEEQVKKNQVKDKTMALQIKKAVDDRQQIRNEAWLAWRRSQQ